VSGNEEKRAKESNFIVELAVKLLLVGFLLRVAERSVGSMEGHNNGTYGVIAFIVRPVFANPFVFYHLAEISLSFSPSQCL